MTLGTARLILREPESGDVDLLRAYHAKNAERFARWNPLPGDDPRVHAGWVEARRAEAQSGKPATFLAFARGAREIAGIVSLTSFGTDPPSATLSYSIDGALEGAGYAFEVVGAVVAYAFDELRLERISAQFDPENVRSGRLLERLGFRNVAISGVIPGMERFMRAHVLAVRDRPVEATA
jgi:ribosomal-protein-alanine N-acetyltransferase